MKVTLLVVLLALEPLCIYFGFEEPLGHRADGGDAVPKA